MPERNFDVRYSIRCALFISITIFFIWFWVNNAVLYNYNLQLTAVIVTIYFFGRLIGQFKKPSTHPDRLALDANVILAIILLITATTGGLNSPLFFLVYLLLFISALIFDTPTTLVLTIAVILFFANSLTTSRAALQLLSLLFIAPLAVLFGRQYSRLITAKMQITRLTNESKSLSRTISQEETDFLIWLSLNFKKYLIRIIHINAELLSDIGRLTPWQKDRVTNVHETAKKLLNEGEKLQKEVDQKTDTD